MVEKSESIKEHVKQRYTEVAKNAQESAGCGCDCGTASTASCCGPVSKETYV